MRVVLPLLPRLQVPIHIQTWATQVLRNWWTILPEGDSAPFRRSLHPADLSCRVVLPGKKRERQTQCYYRGRADDRSSWSYCKFLCV